MKRILFALSLLLIYVTGTAQKPIDNYTPYNFWGKVNFKGPFGWPVRDTTFIPDSIGLVTVRPQDTVPYIAINRVSGVKNWDKLGNRLGVVFSGGGSGSGITQLGNTGNLWLIRVNDSTYAFDTSTANSFYRSLFVQTGGSYANPSWISSLAWSKITGAPTLQATRFDSSYTPLGGNRGSEYIVKSIRIRRNNITITPTQTGDSAMLWNIDVPDTASLSNRINTKADTGSVWKRGGNAGINPATDWFGTPDSTILLAKLNGKTAWRIDPNGTYMRTTFGYMAGDSLTTGIRNTFFGYYAGGSIKTQGSNTAFGANALRLGTGGVAENVAVGYGALTRSQAIRNVGVGSNALTWLTTGKENTSVGNYSSLQNRNGEGNTALGSSALRGNVKGYFNTAVGIISLTQNTTAIDSIKVVSGGSGYTTATVVISAPTVPNDPGLNALQATATAVISGGSIVNVIVTQPGMGYTDVADGYSTPVTATITGDGTGAVLSVVLKSGQYNTGIGTSALANNRTGSNNVSVGFGSFATQLYASNNVGLGYYAGYNISGSYNVVIGGNTGDSIGNKNRHILLADGEGNIRFTSDSSGNSRFWGSGGHRFQSGTTAQRPTNYAGTIRYNTDSSKFEWADGSNWYSFGSGGSGGSTTYKVGTFNGATPDDNGFAIVADSIHMQVFGAEYPGLVPSGGSSTKFLRGDGTWQTISGGTVYVDSVSSNTAGDSLIVFKNGIRSAYKYPSSSAGLTKGTTTISSSATTRVLYDSSGFLSNNANFTFIQSTNLLQVGGTTGRIRSGNFEINVPDANGTYLSAATASLFLISGGSNYGASINGSRMFVGGSTTAHSTLQTGGSFAAPVVSKTTTYTATISDYTITADASSGAFTITLPTAASISGRTYIIKKTDSSGNTVTVGTTSSQTIDGATTYSLASQYKYVKVQSNGSNWIIIGSN